MIPKRMIEQPKWPKKIPLVSGEQEKIRDDFMKYWLEVLPKHYNIIEQFNHRFPKKTFSKGCRTLEIGAGLGAHLSFEDLDAQQYFVLEIQRNLIETLSNKFPQVTAEFGDCQKKTVFSDKFFDRVLAIHVLEHLPDLPSALDEIKRLLKPGGKFCVVIPCDPGLLYQFARNISAKRIFQNLYHQNYDWIPKQMHVNSPEEIISELKLRFNIVEQLYFPTLFPIKDLNLVIGLICQAK